MNNEHFQAVPNTITNDRAMRIYGVGIFSKTKKVENIIGPESDHIGYPCQ